MKKIYFAPETIVQKVKIERHLMAGSDFGLSSAQNKDSGELDAKDDDKSYGGSSLWDD